MAEIVTEPIRTLKGEIELPGDKSISHRAVMIGSIASGPTLIKNFLAGEDVLRTIEAFRAMGIEIKERGDGTLSIDGKGPRGLLQPEQAIYLGNSGTSMRLILGILAGQPFRCELTGDESLSRRPMRRVTQPLRDMGAKVSGTDDANFAPLLIEGGRLSPIDYKCPIASAQVKSAILLAGLYASGQTTITEPAKSRDHTERMLQFFGADLSVRDLTVSIKGPVRLSGRVVEVPGDISSASFFLVAGATVKGSKVTCRSVGLNPTRAGILDVLTQMGAKLEVIREDTEAFEPKGDLRVEGGALKGVRIGPDMVPRVIDELPIIMVAAALADGKTIIEGARELRVKEADRISSMAYNLKELGVEVKETEDGMVIHGQRFLRGARLKSFGDHRTAMSMVIAGLLARNKTTIEDTDCITTSFPGFMETLKRLM